jgi:hypothetical protein
MDGYRPKIEVERNDDHVHRLTVEGFRGSWLTDAEADAWEQYAADAEVGARLRTATGDGVRAEQDPKIPLRVRLSGDETDGHWYVWFHTEADALAFIAQVNGVSVGGDVPSDPSTEGMLVRSGQWLIDNDPDGQTWERLFYGRWHRDHCGGAIPDNPYPVRRIVPPPAPPEPAVEDVALFEAIERGLTATSAPSGVPMELNGDTIVFRDRQGCWRLMYDDAGHGEENRPFVNPDGTVTVLRDPSTSPASQEQDS